MKRTFKKIISVLLLSSILSLSIASSSFAGEAIVTKQIIENIEALSNSINSSIENMNTEELKQYLITNFGATPEEADFLAQYQSYSSPSLLGFPSNPQIGQVYKAEPFTIHVAVDASVAGLAAVILPKLSIAGAVASLADALAVASAVLSLGSAVFGSTVQITPSYTYGYNNDGVLGWTPGYMDIKIV